MSICLKSWRQASLQPFCLVPNEPECPVLKFNDIFKEDAEQKYFNLETLNLENIFSSFIVDISHLEAKQKDC